jgi:predicted nucleic acid-binding protein
LTIVDASVMLAWLNPAEPHHEPATEGLRRAAARGEVWLPLIAFSECLVRPYKQGVTAARRVERKLTSVVGVALPTVEIAHQTAKLRATRTIKTPDALVIATGIVLKATAILTLDERWDGVDSRVHVLLPVSPPGNGAKTGV